MNTIRKLSKFFRLDEPPQVLSGPDVVRILAHAMPIHYRRHARARNYVLRLHANKTVVVTVPRFGTRQFARDFVASRQNWLEKQWRILEARRIAPQLLRPGMDVLFRGDSVLLRTYWNGSRWQLLFGGETAPLADPEGNLRPPLERHLRILARRELPTRARELAAAHNLKFQRVIIRNQKSRWGSCSHHGTISLNWRLIQLPAGVRDYIIVHELMHLRELNHSPRFWAEVARACPDYRASEEWLKKHSGQVGF